MGLTAEEAVRLRFVWRQLAQRALAAAEAPDLSLSEDFSRQALDATQWSSPLEKYADAFVLFALARLAAAHARANVAHLPLRAPALAALATLALAMLGEEPEPPRLPFRADIDG